MEALTTVEDHGVTEAVEADVEQVVAASAAGPWAGNST